MHRVAGSSARAFEDRAGLFQGRVLYDVVYWLLPGSDAKDSWDLGALHCLDYGLDLNVDGVTLGITWGSEFYPYGLSLLDSSVADTVSDAAHISMRVRAPWNELIGQKIERMRVFWGTVESDSSERDRITYPQDLAIDFERGTRMYVSAAKCVDGGKKLFGMADEIAVLTSEPLARAYHVGPYAVRGTT